MRPEEHWRPASARDISKYVPRHLMINTSHDENQSHVNLVKQLRSGPGHSSHKINRADVECGIEGPPMSERIVGGFEAEPNQWPWEVALFIDNAWFCGGSLISENYVLTAAHCVDGASYFDVLAGAHNVRESSEPHRVEITSYNGWTHPHWNPNDLSADIGLIELPSPVDFNDYIKPVCLPAAGDTADEGDLITCVGWGKPSDSAGGISPVLRMVEDRPIISNSECNEGYGIVGPGVVCFDTSGGKGTCNGDSGGACMTRWDAMDKRNQGSKWKQVDMIIFLLNIG